MKTLFLKFLPGVALCAVVLLLGARSPEKSTVATPPPAQPASDLATNVPLGERTRELAARIPPPSQPVEREEQRELPRPSPRLLVIGQPVVYNVACARIAVGYAVPPPGVYEVEAAPQPVVYAPAWFGLRALSSVPAPAIGGTYPVNPIPYYGDDR